MPHLRQNSARRFAQSSLFFALPVFAALLPAEAQAQTVGTTVQIRQGTACLSSPGTEGASVTLAACNADDADQLFFVQGSGANTFQFVGASGGYRLDIFDANTAPGSDVIVWSATGGDNQDFLVEAVTGGVRLRPQHSDTLCVENAGSNAVANTCSGAGGQIFTFTEVAGVGANKDCAQSELYQPYFAENSQGGPNGANVVILTDGLMMVLFAPDSGNPPGILHFYDVENPRIPTLKHRIDNENTQAFREAHALPVAYYGQNEYVAIQTIAGVQFWDLTDPLSAYMKSKIDLPGISGGDYDNVAWQADWQGRYLFVAGSNQGIYVVDTIDIENPKLLQQVPNGTTGGFRIGPLFARGSYMAVGNMDQDGNYAILDITVPDAPTLLSTRKDLPRLYTMTATGNRIYGAGRDGDVTIHSFDNPTAIEEVAIAEITQDSLYVASQDHFLFSGRQNNFVKIDLSDETDPQVVGEGALGRATPDHGQVTPIGNWLFVGNDHGTGSAFFCHATTDDLPPKPTWVYPPDGATQLDPSVRVSVSFSDYLETRDLRTGGFSVREVGGAAVDGIVTYNFNTLGFTPNMPFSDNTAYEIVLRGDGLHDAMGNPVGDEDIVYRFDVGEPVDIPTAGGGSPGTGVGGSGTGAVGTGGSDVGTGGEAVGGTGSGVDGAGETGDEAGCSCRTGAAGGPRSTSIALVLASFLFGGFGLLRRRRQTLGPKHSLVRKA